MQKRVWRPFLKDDGQCGKKNSSPTELTSNDLTFSRVATKNGGRNRCDNLLPLVDNETILPSGMLIQLKNEMFCRTAGPVLRIANHLFVTTRCALVLTTVMICLAACVAPNPLPLPEEPKGREPAQPQPAPAPIHSNLPTIAYTIQVGAFSTTGKAAALARTLEKQGLDAYYFIDGDGLCKVRLERFETKASALRRAMELQSLGRIGGFYIVQPGSTAPRMNPQAELRNNIAQTAHRFLGTPYRWGGASAGRGFDCSGLTMTVYRLNGLELPRNSRSQFRAGTPVRKEALRMGDLVFFSTNRRNRVSHVGVYTGKGKFIHAPGRGKRIRASSLENRYFRQRYIGARRYF
jgi:cell wall-associated NlpC family hydrolase